MPVTDLLTRVTDSTTGRPVISALAAPKAIGAATASLTDVTNWTTTSAIHFVIYETTASGIKDPTTQTDWKGTLSGTTVSNLTLTGGTDRAYSTGAKVELTPTARFAKDLYDNLSAHANQDGTLKTSAVQAALNIAATSTDWTPLANTPTLASSAGQREHVIQFTGVDYTDRLQAGTKLRIPRTGTTPTTSMAFVSASSQYASKTSPTGITFTDDFTCEAWVYLDSYTGSTQWVISRMNSTGTGGWGMAIRSDGRLWSWAYGASGRDYTTHQSVPLNKWTHVATTMDMSAGVGKAYIDGVDVPVLGNGTATSLTQPTTSLSIGRYEGGEYLNGKISNARVWSTIRSAAQIRDNMNMETPASTTGLVAHFKGNGSWNDSSTNANHLTAVGGAVNNSATHPYSATEYAIATKVEYTGGNTDVTVFTGSNCLPNETLGATSYSSARAPYGFPSDTSSWSVIHINRNGTTSIGSGWIHTDGKSLTVPAGKWDLSYSGQMARDNTAASLGLCTLSTTTNSETELRLTAGVYFGAGGNIITFVHKEIPVRLSTQTTYYILQNPQGIGTGGVGLRGDAGVGGPIHITAKCAYI